MGATAHYKSLTGWGLEFLKANPWLVETFVCWEARGSTIRPSIDLLPAERASALRKILDRAVPADGPDVVLDAAARRHPAEFAKIRGDLGRLRSEWAQPGLDIDKTWRAILA